MALAVRRKRPAPRGRWTEAHRLVPAGRTARGRHADRRPLRVVDLESSPGGPCLHLHYPDGSSTTLNADWGGGGSHESEHNGTLVGTVPRDVPDGTYLEFRLGVWPGEITTYVEKISVGEQDASLSLRPSTTSVSPDETATFELVADGIDAGVGSDDLAVNSSNASAVATTDATTIDGIGETAVEDTGAWLGTFNGQTADTGPVTIGTVTVTGGAPGSADLSVRVRSISNESGGQYTLEETTGATVTVERVGPEVIDAAPATDPDDDRNGDVNGDGEARPGDAAVLFRTVFDRIPPCWITSRHSSSTGPIRSPPATLPSLFDEIFSGWF